MDDLSGLDWSAPSKTATKGAPAGSGNYYPTWKPTPSPILTPRASTPLSAQGSGNLKPSSIPSKVGATDSFSNLVSFGSAKQTTLTLQQQQEKIQAEKAQKEAERKKQYDAQFGGLDGLGNRAPVASFTPLTTSRSTTPATITFPQPTKSFSSVKPSNGDSSRTDDDDLFAAFNRDTKVDNSSYYPPPAEPNRQKSTPAAQKPKAASPNLGTAMTDSSKFGPFGEDDDDPFGLGQMPVRKSTPMADLADKEDNDDFLGDLGKPVDQIKRQNESRPPKVSQAAEEASAQSSDDPWDKAVSELVDMGFSTENARRALTESGTGLNVQAAVGWLLNDAHRQAKEKASGKSTPNQVEDRTRAPRNGARTDDSSETFRKDSMPAWMREGRDQSQPRRDDSRSPALSDNDLSRQAAAVGSNLLKTANSLWKTSQKKVQKAVSDFQQESGDPSQPKWMRSNTPDQQYPQEKRKDPEQRARGGQEGGSESNASVTDEAMMLEGNSRPLPGRTKPAADPRFLTSNLSFSRDQSPISSNPSTGRSSPLPRWQQQVPVAPIDRRAQLSKQAVEEQSAQAYVSPSRRKKVTAPRENEQPNLLSDSNFPAKGAPVQQPLRQAQASGPPPSKSPLSSKPSTPIPVRPTAPARNIPALSPSALSTSTQHRLTGTAHFKRGDYASAHASYTQSLSSLPQNHPITIVLLCNRSLTALKTGDPKASVADADTALTLIGSSRGESEVINLHTDGKKDMKEFWGKALTRKAEALEQMEHWKDAAAVWQQAIEAGVGSATAIQGRERCEKALKPKPVAKVAPKVVPKKPRPAASDLAPPSAQSTEAVSRLRAANAAAEKADDEKFALSDSVDARILAWREGRKDNLRALLGGMDTVLWEGSGWKKVGMHELVMNNKVKIQYMKAIAKVHPDKLPQNASTEMKMISASVFATLNEAWDKFKTDNGM